jgi:serine/threonine protein kinase
MDPLDRLYAGDRIGNYRIEIEIATNATWSTYRALHLVLPRRAVIKLMHAEAEQSEIVHHLREACILDALHHPGIVRVYESGLHAGHAWFATELVEGPTLRSLFGSVDPVDAVVLVRDIVEVFEHAYRRGIVHCGIRPERILMTGRSRGYPICVADWGEARAHDASPQPLAASASASPYTAPELVMGDPIDDRSDVFAIGVLAYELLTQRTPALGQGPHVSAEHFGVPAELARVVDSMLRSDRWDRPSSSEVYADLCWLADAAVAQLRPTATAASASLLRIRRPRWTPALDFADGQQTDSDGLALGEENTRPE